MVKNYDDVELDTTPMLLTLPFGYENKDKQQMILYDILDRKKFILSRKESDSEGKYHVIVEELNDAKCNLGPDNNYDHLAKPVSNEGRKVKDFLIICIIVLILIVIVLTVALNNNVTTIYKYKSHKSTKDGNKKCSSSSKDGSKKSVSTKQS